MWKATARITVDPSGGTAWPYACSSLSGEQTYLLCYLGKRYVCERETVLTPPAAQHDPFQSNMLNQQNSVVTLGCMLASAANRGLIAASASTNTPLYPRRRSLARLKHKKVLLKEFAWKCLNWQQRFYWSCIWSSSKLKKWSGRFVARSGVTCPKEQSD